MRISYWSSDVCSSDLIAGNTRTTPMLSIGVVVLAAVLWLGVLFGTALYGERHPAVLARHWRHVYALSLAVHCTSWSFYGTVTQRSEEHTSDLQSLMRISYAVFCLKKNRKHNKTK